MALGCLPFTLVSKHGLSLDWLGSRPQVSTHLWVYPPSSGITNTLHHSWLSLNVCAGDQAQTLLLAWQILYQLSHALSSQAIISS